jgi:hypothetical protein
VTEHLLAVAALAAAGFLVLVHVTAAIHREQLDVRPDLDVPAERPSIRALAANRYVVLLASFQMLSAVESQWLDFLVFDRASARYPDEADLAEFVGRFSAIAYGADIVFLVLVAGLLLRRFGLRYGLVANSAAVLAVVLAIIVLSVVQGATSTVVFVLVVAARSVDLTFSDGASRTSLSAAYQVVTPSLRASAPAMIEGIGVPVAIGASGVVLVAVEALGGTEGIVLPVLTAGVVGAWFVVGGLAYVEYRRNLLAGLRDRLLDPGDPAIDGAAGAAIAERLLESDDDGDVWLGVDVLTSADPQAATVALERLARTGRWSVQVEALARLTDRAPEAAAHVARDLLDRSDGARTGDTIALSTSVRVAAGLALAVAGDQEARAALAVRAAILAEHDDRDERVTAARIVGALPHDQHQGVALLRALMADADTAVVCAALDAIDADDADLVDDVIERLGTRGTRGPAFDALVRVGPAALERVDRELSRPVVDVSRVIALVHVARSIGGPAAGEVLRRHATHPDREVGLAVLRALAALDAREPGVASAIVARECEDAVRILRGLVVVGDAGDIELLGAALRDAWDLTRRRTLAALALGHERHAVERVARQLAHPDRGAHILAVEWLDATLRGEERLALDLIDPDVGDRERLSRLLRAKAVDVDPGEVLADLIADAQRAWRSSWLAACAVAFAHDRGHLPLSEIVDLVALGTTGSDPLVVETLAARVAAGAASSGAGLSPDR